MITESTGTMGFGYTLNGGYINNLFGEKETLQHFVSEAIPNNETEKFILRMWERMESGEKNELGEKDFYSPVPINLIL